MPPLSGEPRRVDFPLVRHYAPKPTLYQGPERRLLVLAAAHGLAVDAQSERRVAVAHFVHDGALVAAERDSRAGYSAPAASPPASTTALRTRGRWGRIRLGRRIGRCRWHPRLLTHLGHHDREPVFGLEVAYGSEAHLMARVRGARIHAGGGPGPRQRSGRYGYTVTGAEGMIEGVIVRPDIDEARAAAEHFAAERV